MPTLLVIVVIGLSAANYIKLVAQIYVSFGQTRAVLWSEVWTWPRWRNLCMILCSRNREPYCEAFTGFNLSKDWNLITRTLIPVMQTPDPAPGVNGASGLGDINFSLFLSPASGRPRHLGHRFQRWL